MTASAESEHAGEEVLFEGRPALVPSLGVLLLAIVTLGLWLLPRWWHQGSKLYRVTTRRIVVETGVLSKRLEQIDLLSHRRLQTIRRTRRRQQRHHLARTIEYGLANTSSIPMYFAPDSQALTLRERP